MIDTPKKPRGTLKPEVVEVPKYQKGCDGKRRELSTVEHGLIIAFFVIYGDPYLPSSAVPGRQ